MMRTSLGTVRPPSLGIAPLFSISIVLLGIAGHGSSWLWPGFWPGAWCGQASMIWLASQQTPLRAFGLGMGMGCLANLMAFHWAPQALTTCLDASLWQAQLLFFTLCLWEAIAFALFMMMVAIGCHNGVRGIGVAPVAWVSVEYGWPKIFPWMLGYTQLELLPLIQIADLTGPCGIGFCMTTLAAIPTAISLAWRSLGQAKEARYALRFIVGAIALCSATLAYGAWRLSSWPQLERRYPILNVAVMQVDSSTEGCDQRLRARTIALDSQVQLACWPESAIGVYRADLASFADPERTLSWSHESHHVLQPTVDCRCDVLMGGKTYRAGCADEGPYSMTAFLVDREQSILGTYHKRTLLPFGEYVPGEQLMPVLREWATLHDVTEPGSAQQPPLLSSCGAKLGAIICYEDILPANARLSCSQGAEVLISIINAARFENPLTLEQHRRLAMLRAVENRRYFLRSASTGVTCIIAPTGRVVAELPLKTEGTLQQTIALSSEQTIYTRYGDYFPLLCCFACAYGLASARRSFLRAKNANQNQSTTPDKSELGVEPTHAAVEQ